MMSAASQKARVLLVAVRRMRFFQRLKILRRERQ
jgi:hypothetical protein